MKNNKGFTLMEMIIVIAIIGVLSITVSFSANQVQESSVVKSNKETLNQIFNAARIYSNLTKEPNGCISPSECAKTEGCNITIDCLIKKGLLDENIVKKYNPLLDNKKFNLNDTINVKSGSETTVVSITCKDKQINSETINEGYKSITEWGKC